LVTKSAREIAPGDRLAKTPLVQELAYVPHAPAATIKGRVIAGPDETFSEIASLQVVVINRGRREGMEVGHVLALYPRQAARDPCQRS
jgi:hypothetical protein